MSAAALAERVAELGKTFSGELLRPGAAGYEETRLVHNGLIDKRPALIARCRGVGDIADAIKLGRECGLEIAVRGGGHNVAGRSTVEGGLMIDLAAMTGMRVDPQARIAHAQGGVTWGLFNRETQLHGLATTGGVISTTGIAGLTLGGGIGWLMGKHALALDNLVSVDLVLADGSIVSASAENEPDLFWAARGGGGNFGVAASFGYRLHPVGPMVIGGVIAYPFDKAGEMLRFYRELTADLPDEEAVFAGLLHAPDGSGTKLAAMVVFHCGPLDEGERAAARIRAFGAPALDAVGPLPYTAMNSMLDAGYPRGALNYWKSNFLASLSDAAIDTMIDRFAQCPAPMGQIMVEHFHGAVARVGATDTAFAHRMTGYNLLVLGQWLEASGNDACIDWSRNTFDAMRPFMGVSRYVNYLGDDEQSGATADAYGPNYLRLQELKKKYDPENVFHLNQNIQPLA